MEDIIQIESNVFEPNQRIDLIFLLFCNIRATFLSCFIASENVTVIVNVNCLLVLKMTFSLLVHRNNDSFVKDFSAYEVFITVLYKLLKLTCYMYNYIE